MTKPKIIKLPFIETLSRSFMYTLCSPKLFLQIAALGLAVLVIEMLGGFPVLCSLGEGKCQEGAWQTTSSLAILLVSVAMIINYCRAVILKADIDFISLGFWKRSVKYILATLLLGLAIILPLMGFGIVYGMISYASGTEEPFGGIGYIVMFVVLVAWCIYLAPAFLIFAAITVDDKTITVAEAYRLTKGNFNKIFWGQSIMMIPGAILLYVLALIYNIIGADMYITDLLFTILVLALSFLDSCFKASFFAHVYQYFVFYKNKKSKEKAHD